eukprot:795-Eustigmatos_ZCMA.PRE.1
MDGLEDSVHAAVVLRSQTTLHYPQTPLTLRPPGQLVACANCTYTSSSCSFLPSVHRASSTRSTLAPDTVPVQ